MYDNSMYMHNNAASTGNINPGVTLGILFFWLIIIASAYVINSVLWAQIFKKAGVPQWKAWVPVYNQWIVYELGDQKGFWAVLAFIPVVNLAALVFMYIAMHNIGLKLGKSGAFVLLAIFLPIVWLIWLAVDESVWTGKKPEPQLASTADTTPTPEAPHEDTDTPSTPPVSQ